MTAFALPLQLNPSGFLEIDKYLQDFLQSRIRIFIFSGDQRYLKLPSPGIFHFWQKINILGPTGKFCDKDIFPIKERVNLENSIKNEFNDWYRDIMINEVKIVGDVNTTNGIIFRNSQMEYCYLFEFCVQGRNLLKNSIGNYNIIEIANVIY